MGTLTIILLIFLACLFSFLVYLIIKSKKERERKIRHFVGRKEISKSHKFSEWKKCEICLNCYKKKSTIEVIRGSLELKEHPLIISERFDELKKGVMKFGGWQITSPLVLTGNNLDVKVIFDNNWKPKSNNFYVFYCKKCRNEVCQFTFSNEKRIVDTNDVLKFLGKHNRYYHEWKN